MAEYEKDNRRIRFVGLDTETTGLTTASAVIQVGVAFNRFNVFGSDMKPFHGAVIDAEALKINKFTPERMEAAPWSDDVYAAFMRHLQIMEIDLQAEKLIPVGWNVGSFDMAMLEKSAPRFASLFHYQAADLNSMSFAIAGERHKTFKKWMRKTAVKEHPIQDMIKLLGEHNAMYDAAESLSCFNFIRANTGFRYDALLLENEVS